LAELFTPKSPRPTRAQISAVFKDADMARKVEKIFDDLISAAESANANAALIESIQASRPIDPPALQSLEFRLAELALRLDAAERRARAYDDLARRINDLTYLIAGA
jgi:hypothetical protein